MENKIVNEVDNVSYETSRNDTSKSTLDEASSNMDSLNNVFNSADEFSIEDKPSWFMRKYRLIIFVLLAWCIYMVVAKEFDFVLAYLIGQKLPNHLLGHLILPAFVAVELQVLMLTLFMKRSQETQQSKSMIVLALSLVGVPEYILKFVTKMYSSFMSVLMDLCVYIFVIVVLKIMDENV